MFHMFFRISKLIMPRGQEGALCCLHQASWCSFLLNLFNKTLFRYKKTLHSPYNTDAPGEGDHDEQDALENALPDETGDGQGDEKPYQCAGHTPECGLDHDGVYSPAAA